MTQQDSDRTALARRLSQAMGGGQTGQLTDIMVRLLQHLSTNTEDRTAFTAAIQPAPAARTVGGQHKGD